MLLMEYSLDGHVTYALIDVKELMIHLWPSLTVYGHCFGLLSAFQHKLGNILVPPIPFPYSTIQFVFTIVFLAVGYHANASSCAT